MMITGENHVAVQAAGKAAFAAFMNHAVDLPVSAVLNAPSDFDSDATLMEMGKLRICHVRSTPHVAVVDSPRTWAPQHGPRKVRLILPLSGRLHIKRPGSEFTVSGEQWCMVSAHPPFVSEVCCESEYLILVIPDDQADHLGPFLSYPLHTPFDGKTGSSRVFLDLLRSAIREKPNMASSECALVSDAIMYFLRSTLDSLKSQTSTRRSDDILYHQICTYIDNHLFDPGLTVEKIAKRLGCSKRYVHLVFARSGARKSIKQYIIARRLQLCREKIVSDSKRMMSLSEIAFDYGFQDPSYFSRLFRREFGVSPSELRN